MDPQSEWLREEQGGRGRDFLGDVGWGWGNNFVTVNKAYRYRCSLLSCIWPVRPLLFLGKADELPIEHKCQRAYVIMNCLSRLIVIQHRRRPESGMVRGQSSLFNCFYLSHMCTCAPGLGMPKIRPLAAIFVPVLPFWVILEPIFMASLCRHMKCEDIR